MKQQLEVSMTITNDDVDYCYNLMGMFFHHVPFMVYKPYSYTMKNFVFPIRTDDDGFVTFYGDAARKRNIIFLLILSSLLKDNKYDIPADEEEVGQLAWEKMEYYLLNLSIKSYGYEPIIDKEIYDIFKINDVDRLIEYFEEEFNVTITKKDMEKYDEFDLSGTFDCRTMNYIAFFIPTGKKISQEDIEIYVDDLTCETILPFRLNPSVLLVNATYKGVQGMFLYLAWGVDEYNGDFVPLETLDLMGLMYQLLYIYRKEVLSLV